MNHIVISFIGPDRKGLVDNISNIIKKHKGNWQTSSMHHLSGYFAGVIEIAIDANDSIALVDALNNVNDLQVLHAVSAPSTKDTHSTITLELTANDRAGIIQDISSVIHRNNGNLLKLVSKQQSAAHTGQLMFKAKAKIALAETDVDDLIAALENIADDLMVDIKQ